MKRRAVLAALGTVETGTAGYVYADSDRALTVRTFLSDGAARYPDRYDRIRRVVERAFPPDVGPVAVDAGGVVDVSTENAHDLMRRGEWPGELATSAVGLDLGGPTPAPDVNLLVTDGQVEDFPTGMGVPHVAAVGGARPRVAPDRRVHPADRPRLPDDARHAVAPPRTGPRARATPPRRHYHHRR